MSTIQVSINFTHQLNAKLLNAMQIVLVFSKFDRTWYN